MQQQSALLQVTCGLTQQGIKRGEDAVATLVACTETVQHECIST